MQAVQFILVRQGILKTSCRHAYPTDTSDEYILFERGKICTYNTETLKENVHKQIQRSLKLAYLTGASDSGHCFVALLRSGVFEVYRVDEQLREYHIAIVKGASIFIQKLKQLSLSDDSVVRKHSGIDSPSAQFTSRRRSSSFLKISNDGQKLVLILGFEIWVWTKNKEFRSALSSEQTLSGAWVRITRDGICQTVSHNQAVSSSALFQKLPHSQGITTHCIHFQAEIVKVNRLSMEASQAEQPEMQGIRSVILRVEEYSYSPKSVLKGDELIHYREPTTVLSTLNLNLDYFEPKTEELILKYDSKGKALFLAICTDVMIYSQYVFFSPSSRACMSSFFILDIVVKLINLINENDQPPCDSKGKTSLRIADAVWSSNDEYVVILFKSRCIAVASRLGSLIAFLNPTFQNFQKSNPDMRPQEVGLSETEPKMFNPLFFQEQIGTSSFLGSDFLSIKRGAQDDYVVLVDRHYLRLKLFIQDKKIVKNAYLALRLMLSLQEKKFDSELLASLPFLFDGILPQKNDFIFQTRNVGVKNAAEMMRKSTNEINRQKIELKSSIKNEKVKSKQLVINFSNALFCLLWDKNAPLNYRSWIFELFEESFNYLLFKDESQSAFHLVKIFEGVLIPHKPEEEKQQHLNLSTCENLYQGQANLIKQRVELLVYYLIQFRNHQSNNFNILNLSLSVFLHRQFKHLRRFSLYIKRIIRCISENTKTHESEIDKEIFLGTQIENNLSQFPTIFPGLFDDQVQPRFKTLQKCYKWFFTDDLVQFIGLLGYNEMIGQKASLRMRMEHTPEPLIKIVAFLISNSETYVESEVGHYIENKDSYVSFVSHDSDGYSQKRREATDRKNETPGDTGTSNFESDFMESSSLGVSEERKRSKKEGAAQKFQEQMLALKENSVEFYYCNLANILVTIAFSKLKTFLHHPLPLTSIFDGLWHGLHGKTPHIVDLVLTALQEGDRPSEATVSEEVLLWESTVLLTTVDELEALFLLRHKIQQHLSPQHFFRYTEMLILLLSKKLLSQTSQKQVETANWIKQLYYQVVKKDILSASISSIMSRGSIKVSFLRNVTHLVSQDSEFFLADGSLQFFVQSAEKATYYLNLSNLQAPPKPQYAKLASSCTFRFSSPFLDLVPCSGTVLEFLMNKSHNQEQRVKVVSGVTLMATIEYACQCLFSRSGFPFVEIDPTPNKIAHFFQKVKKHTHGDFQASVYLSKHFFDFLNPKTMVGEYQLTLASFTNSLCNLILLLYIYKLLAQLHAAKTKLEKFKVAMRLSFFSPFPIHRSDQIDRCILSHLKARKENIPEEELELFACYCNLERFMSSKHAELWARVYLKYYKNNKNYQKSEIEAKKLRVFLNGNTIKSSPSSRFIFLLKDPKFTHFLEGVARLLSDRSLCEARAEEEKDSLFLLQQRLNTVCCDLQEGYKIPFHSQLRCSPNELKWHVKESNFALKDFLKPELQKSSRNNEELKEIITSEGTKVEAVKLSRQICGKETPVAQQEKKFDFSKLKIQELISQTKPEKKLQGGDIAVDALTSEGSEMLSQSARKARYKMKKIMKVQRGKQAMEGGLPFQAPPKPLPQANKLSALEKIVNNISHFQMRGRFLHWREGGPYKPQAKTKKTHRKIQSHSNFKGKVGQQTEAFSLMVVRDSSRSKRTSSNTPRGRGGTFTSSVPKRHIIGGDRSKFKDKRLPSRGRIQTLPDTDVLIQTGSIGLSSQFYQDRKGNIKINNLLTEASHSHRGGKGHQRRQTPLIGGNYLKVGHQKGSSMNLGGSSPFYASERKQRKSSREVVVPLDSPSSDLLKAVKLKKVNNVQKFMEKFESIKQRIQKVQAEAQQLSIDLRVTGPIVPKEDPPHE